MAEDRVFAIVLAAGSASRFGSAKQVQAWRGRPLVAHAVRTAEAVCGSRSVLIAGYEWRAVVDACRPLQGFFVNFRGFEAGMAASIACGVRAVAGAADAVLLLLADQPLVTRDHLQRLIDRWAASPDEIVASAYGGTRGPPVIFPARTFARLARLEGDRGARPILDEEGERVQEVPFADAAVDIDRPEDLRGLR